MESNYSIETLHIVATYIINAMWLVGTYYVTGFENRNLMHAFNFVIWKT